MGDKGRGRAISISRRVGTEVVVQLISLGSSEVLDVELVLLSLGMLSFGGD